MTPLQHPWLVTSALTKPVFPVRPAAGRGGCGWRIVKSLPEFLFCPPNPAVHHIPVQTRLTSLPLLHYTKPNSIAAQLWGKLCCDVWRELPTVPWCSHQTECCHSQCRDKLAKQPRQIGYLVSLPALLNTLSRAGGRTRNELKC